MPEPIPTVVLARLAIDKEWHEHFGFRASPLDERMLLLNEMTEM